MVTTIESEDKVKHILEEMLSHYREEIKPLLDNEITRERGEGMLVKQAVAITVDVLNSNFIFNYHHGNNFISYCEGIVNQIRKKESLTYHNYQLFEASLAQLILAMKSENR